MSILKRITAAGLVLLSVSGLFACKTATGGGESSGSTGTPASSGTVTTGTPETDFWDTLPDVNFNDEDFVIMGWEEYLKLWFPEEEDQDEISASLEKRNNAVEEKLHVKLVRQNAPYFLDAVSMTETAVLSNEDIYDLTVQNALYGAQSSLNNIYLNLYELEYCDFTKPWWPEQSVRELTFDGKMFMVSSYATYSGLYESAVMFFNKKMAEDNRIESPYTLVDNMEWTIDAVFGLAKNVYEDLDRDGEVNWRDSFGYSSTAAPSFWLTAAGISTVEKYDDGTLRVPTDYSRLTELVDKLKTYCYGRNEVFLTEPHEMYDDNAVNIFAAGRSMFTPCYLRSAVNTFRYAAIDYGILPLPMLDENQKEYRTFSDDYLVAVPSIVGNREKVSVVLEALSYEGCYGVTPTFYNITMKTKLAEGDDLRMLDIINSTRNTPFDFVYDYFAGFFTCLPDIMTIRDGLKQELASYYAEHLSAVQEHYTGVTKGFAKSGNAGSK